MNIWVLKPPFEKIINSDFAGGFGIEADKKFSSPPLTIGYIASSLISKGHSVKIIDAPLEKISFEKIVKSIVNENVDILCVETTIVSVLSDLTFCRKLKSITPKIKVILFGAICKFLKERHIYINDIDIVILGEPENIISKIIENIEIGKKINDKKLYSIVKNLNSLNFPAYSLYNLKLYNRMDIGKKFFNILSSRGCHYGCIYCPYPITMGEKCRFRSIQNVIDELNEITSFGIKKIVFRDPIFTFYKNRIVEMSKKIVKNKINIEWVCETRVDLLDDDIINSIQKAGCKEVILGIETGDEKILNSIGKIGLTKNLVRKNVKKLKDAGIESMGLFMIGFPDDNKKTVLETIEFAQEVDFRHKTFFTLTPYPGTKIRNIMEKENLILSNDFRDYNGWNCVIKTRHLSKNEIIELAKHANSIC